MSERQDLARALIKGIEEPRLELASGYSPTPGFLHLDLNIHAPELDWCGHADDLAWDDDTFVEIRACDILEHLSWRDTLEALKEWYRVLRPGGRIYIQVPDAETIMVQYASNPNGQIAEHLKDYPPIVSVARKLLGGHIDGEYAKEGDDFRLNAHYALFSMSSLRWYAEAAGFEVESLARNPHPNLLAWFRKPTNK